MCLCVCVSCVCASCACPCLCACVCTAAAGLSVPLPSQFGETQQGAAHQDPPRQGWGGHVALLQPQNVRLPLSQGVPVPGCPCPRGAPVPGCPCPWGAPVPRCPCPCRVPRGQDRSLVRFLPQERQQQEPCRLPEQPPPSPACQALVLPFYGDLQKNPCPPPPPPPPCPARLSKARCSASLFSSSAFMVMKRNTTRLRKAPMTVSPVRM